MKLKQLSLASAVISLIFVVAAGSAYGDEPTKVNLDNFVQAESTHYFNKQ